MRDSGERRHARRRTLPSGLLLSAAERAASWGDGAASFYLTDGGSVLLVWASDRERLGIGLAEDVELRRRTSVASDDSSFEVLLR